MSEEIQTLSMIERGQALEINSDADYAKAAEFLLAATELDRRIEDWFKPLKQKAKEAHAALCDEEKATRKPLQAVIGFVSGLRIGWRQRQEIKAKAEQARLQALADKLVRTHGDMMGTVVQVAPKVTETEGVHQRSRWVAVVDDVSKLPREYMVPDESKLNALARRMKQGFNVPGAHAENHASEVVRSDSWNSMGDTP